MSLSLSRRSALFAGAGAAALPMKAWAQEAAHDHSELAAAVDAYVIRCMAAFPDQPALGMALVKDGEAILTRGYGVKAMDRPGRASTPCSPSRRTPRTSRPRRWPSWSTRAR